MGDSKKTVTVVSIAVVFALGLGIAIGTAIKGKTNVGDNNVANPANDKALNDLPVEELGAKLSNVMLPEEEFGKLSTAIYQTAMGLFMAQAQQAGINVSDAAQQELKKSIDDKYSRKYFEDMNANSMKELSKPELISIIGFYNTEAGIKFLKLSPKIIQSTMSAVQADLTQWLPKTVDALVAKLKGGSPAEEKGEADKGELNAPKDAEPKKDDGENS